MPFYAVTGIPPGTASPDTHGPAAGLSAFLPNLTRMAASGAQTYKSLTGGPAQRQVITNMSATAPSPDVGDIAQMGWARSTDSPDETWKDLYVAHPEPEFYPGAGMPIQISDPVRPQDTTMLPVPAVSYRALWLRQQANLAYGVQPAGQRQVVAWPRQLQRWLPRNSLSRDPG